jgi:hypothetical protein
MMRTLNYTSFKLSISGVDMKSALQPIDSVLAFITSTPCDQTKLHVMSHAEYEFDWTPSNSAKCLGLR